LVSQNEPSCFSRFKTEEDIEDHYARDGTNTSLVSSRTHAQPEEEDLADMGTEAKEGISREGERRALQHHSVGDPDEVGIEGEGED
jgi:hypothetical protein